MVQIIKRPVSPWEALLTGLSSGIQKAMQTYLDYQIESKLREQEERRQIEKERRAFEREKELMRLQHQLAMEEEERKQKAITERELAKEFERTKRELEKSAVNRQNILDRLTLLKDLTLARIQSMSDSRQKSFYLSALNSHYRIGKELLDLSAKYDTILKKKEETQEKLNMINNYLSKQNLDPQSEEYQRVQGAVNSLMNEIRGYDDTLANINSQIESQKRLMDDLEKIMTSTNAPFDFSPKGGKDGNGNRKGEGTKKQESPKEIFAREKIFLEEIEKKQPHIKPLSAIAVIAEMTGAKPEEIADVYATLKDEFLARRKGETTINDKNIGAFYAFLMNIIRKRYAK